MKMPAAGTRIRVDGGNSDDVGRYASMAFVSTGEAWIAYYDTTNQDLEIAHGDGVNGWTIKTVDSTGNQGMYASLALTKAGLPRISYEGTVGGNGGGGLKFASFDGSKWTITNVDVDTDADSFDSDADGQETSLALDGKDCPRISFATTLAAPGNSNWTMLRLTVIPSPSRRPRQIRCRTRDWNHISCSTTRAIRTSVMSRHLKWAAAIA